MLKNCVMCGIEINVRRKDTMYCADCKKKKQVQWSMEYKKRKIPTTEIGVGSGNSTNNKGTKSASYKDGIGTYTKYKKDSCEICGSKENLCVHHKDKNRHNNHPSNLQTLCRKCHTKEHFILKNIKRNSKGQFTRAK